MISSDIWTQLIETLKAPSLSYMAGQKVYEGRRYDFEPESLPHIQVEIVSDGEYDQQMNNTDRVYLRANLFAFTAQNIGDDTKSIVGDDIYRGILDINNDIRAVLKSSYSLGGLVYETKLDTTQFDTLEQDKYPIRGMVMPLRILYRQTDGV